MNLDDLKERLKSEFQQLWDRIQDSSLYGQLKDRYENLTPVMQKVVLATVAVIIGYILIMTPLDSFTNSSSTLTGFEDDRQMIRDLLKVSRETASAPDLTPAPPIDALQSRIQGELTSSRLTPEQIVSVGPVSNSSTLIPDSLMTGQIEVSVKQINLRQMTEIGTKLSNLGDAVKLKDLILRPNGTDSRYMDVTYKIAILNIPSNDGDSAEEAPAPPRGRGRK